MKRTQPERAPELRRPIDLSTDHRAVGRRLWRAIAGDDEAPWLCAIGAAVETSESIDAALDAWERLLDREVANSDHRVTARGVRESLAAHRESMRRNRTAYSHTTPQEIAHKYWPSGQREHLERENLFTMPLAPRVDPFVTWATPIMSAGSCFASEIGKALRAWGYNYFITEPGPAELGEEERWAQHYGHFNARYGRIFNTPALRQLVERGLGLLRLDPLLYQYEGRWRDPYRDGLQFDSPQEWLATLPEFEAALRRALLEAEVFILTLGVNEVWRFRHDGTTLSRVPWRLSPALLERDVLTVDDNVRELQRLHDVLVAANPLVRFILSVSPIPLLATFRSDDCNILVANAHSKATLLVAAHAFAAANPRVTYFPAYEAVMHGTRDPFTSDGRHVTAEAVERVMREFRRTFTRES